MEESMGALGDTAVRWRALLRGHFATTQQTAEAVVKNPRKMGNHLLIHKPKYSSLSAILNSLLDCAGKRRVG